MRSTALELEPVGRGLCPLLWQFPWLRHLRSDQVCLSHLSFGVLLLFEAQERNTWGMVEFTDLAILT